MPQRVVIAPGLVQVPPTRLVLPGGFTQVPFRPVISGIASISSGVVPPVVLPLDPYTADLSIACSVVRRLLTSYTGVLLRARRSSDDEERNIGYDPLTNLLDVSDLLGWAGSDSAYVVQVADQATGALLNQSTASQQPRIVNAGVLDVDSDGNPTMVFDGSDDVMESGIAPVDDWSAILTTSVASASFYGTLLCMNSYNMLIREFGAADSSEFLYDGTNSWTSAAAIINTWRTFTMLASKTGGSSEYRVDGVASVVSSPGGSGVVSLQADLFRVGSWSTAGTNPWNGQISELTMFSAVISGAQLTGVETALGGIHT